MTKEEFKDNISYIIKHIAEYRKEETKINNFAKCCNQFDPELSKLIERNANTYKAFLDHIEMMTNNKCTATPPLRTKHYAIGVKFEEFKSEIGEAVKYMNWRRKTETEAMKECVNYAAHDLKLSVISKENVESFKAVNDYIEHRAGSKS